jgi:hypothetical protein
MHALNQIRTTLHSGNTHIQANAEREGRPQLVIFGIEARMTSNLDIGQSVRGLWSNSRVADNTRAMKAVVRAKGPRHGQASTLPNQGSV